MSDSPASTVGCMLRPMPGESECGDRCAFWQDVDRLTLLVADGLGHGAEAAVAAQAAVDCVATRRALSLDEIFAACDAALHATRGAALALAQVEGDRLSVASVGSIRAVLFGRQRELRLGGARGIVGAGYQGLRPETVVLAAGEWLALYSDGLPELLPLATLCGQTGIDASRLAGEALARWASARDDAALLLYRYGGNSCLPPCRPH